MVKKSRPQKIYNHLVDTICPICGKNFIPAAMHVYNDGNKAVCSYHCHLEAFHRREAEKKKKVRHYRGTVIDPDRDDNIRKLAKEGASLKEISDKYDLGISQIRRILREDTCL